MNKTLETIKQYTPYNKQEIIDKQQMLEACKNFSNLLSRQNTFYHFTASAFIINCQHTKVLSCFHNIYNSWSLPGGHADNIDDPLFVAQKETSEECGLNNLTLLSSSPVALDVLTTERHVKNGNYVSAHLHFNLCFLFEADDTLPIRPKLDENSKVEWIVLKDLPRLAREPQMKMVYLKIIERIQNKRY